MDVEKLFIEQPTFETPRLRMRRITLEDAVDYFSFASDPSVTRHTIWNTHQSLNDTRTYIESLIQKYEANEAYYWGIINKETNKLIGRTGYIHWDLIHEKTEVGFAISSPYWNQGMITEATSRIIEYGFTQIGFNRIEGRCNVDNQGSGRVMEKLGMKLEGVLRGQLKIKGEFIDQRMYAILKHDYEMNNKTK